MNIETTKNNMWKVGLATLSVLCLLFVAVLVGQVKNVFTGEGHWNKSDSNEKNTITVNGKGEVVTTPDIATFNFSVSETAKNVSDAQTVATAKINAAMKALADAKVDTVKDVKTLSYNINPHYEYSNGVCNSVTGICSRSKSVLTGYDVSQTLQVKVRDLSNAGTLFTTIGSLNVQNVDSLQFSVDKVDVKKDEAQAIAIEDAKVHADKLAQALGVHIVRVSSFSESSSSGNPYPIMYEMNSMGSGKSAAVAPEVPVGEQKVTANVSVTYEIR